MVEALLFVGLLVTVSTGFNIGGSPAGTSFGLAIGSGVLGELTAVALMTGFTPLDGRMFGRKVVAKVGGEIVLQGELTLAANVAVLFLVGLALLISNTFGVPASTLMTAVGTITDLGLTNGSLDSRVILEIISWWVIVPITVLWICAVIDRYIYPYPDVRLKLDQNPGTLVRLDRDDDLPRPRLGPSTTYRELGSTVLVIVVACYMAFFAGVSNIANAVAPLVDNGALEMDTSILIAGGAIGLDASTIARRMPDTIGNDLAQLPILAAFIAETVSTSLIFFLSAIDIPASLAMSATMCTVGLGWRRTVRTITLDGALNDDRALQVSVNTLTVECEDEVPKMGEEALDELSTQDLLDLGTTGQVIFFWMLMPSLSALVLYTLFSAGIV